jgi:hypothetical protein
MPNTLYTITDELHEVIQAKAKKFGVEIDLTNNVFVIGNRICRLNAVETPDYFSESTNSALAIQAPQIRQILLAFKEVLKKTQNVYIAKTDEQKIWIANKISETLCRKWLDGLQPLFESNPELVLSELLEILKAL